MSLILRWFEDNGERHRAYYRERDGVGDSELVIAGRDWLHAEPTAQPRPLEELSDEALLRMARSWRTRQRGDAVVDERATSPRSDRPDHAAAG